MVSMRWFMLIFALLLGFILIGGSSGNFRAYSTDRGAEFGVVDGNDSYIAYRCSSNPIRVNASSTMEFEAITLENLMDRPVTLHVETDGSGLPEGLNADVDGSTYTLDPGEEVSIGGSFSAGTVEDGIYGVPLTVYAEWDGGSARIEDCSMYAEVEGPTYSLTKEVVGGNYTYPVGRNALTLRINFTNNGPEGDFVVRDVIPGRADVVYHLQRPVPSSGWVHFGLGHCGCWFIVWRVHVAQGETVTLEIPIEVLFSRPGDYVLNLGARLCGTDTVSNKITVHVIGGN